MRRNARKLSVKLVGGAIIVVVAAGVIAASALVSLGQTSEPSADPPATPGPNPSLEPIPVIEVPDSAASIVLGVVFSSPTDAEFVSAEVSQAAPPARAGGPPLIEVEAFGLDGGLIEQFNDWHPLWIEEHDEDGGQRVVVQESGEGRFVVAFAPDLETVSITDIGLDEKLIDIDVRPVIVQHCVENESDPACSAVCVGDVNRDGHLTVRDLIAVSRAMETTADSPRWNPDADIDGDGLVGVLDLLLVFGSFGKPGCM